jgi:hypothetical protein
MKQYQLLLTSGPVNEIGTLVSAGGEVIEAKDDLEAVRIAQTTYAEPLKGSGYARLTDGESHLPIREWRYGVAQGS